MQNVKEFLGVSYLASRRILSKRFIVDDFFFFSLSPACEYDQKKKEENMIKCCGSLRHISSNIFAKNGRFWYASPSIPTQTADYFIIQKNSFGIQSIAWHQAELFNLIKRSCFNRKAELPHVFIAFITITLFTAQTTFESRAQNQFAFSRSIFYFSSFFFSSQISLDFFYLHLITICFIWISFRTKSDFFKMILNPSGNCVKE